MSVSSTSASATTSLADYYAQLRAQRAAGTAPTTSTQDASGKSGAARPGGMEDRLATALSDQGISGDQLTSLKDKIETAVQNAKANSSDPGAVRTAVDGVLKDAGVDLDAFHKDMASPGGAHGAHRGHGKRPDSDGDGGSDASNTSTSSTSSPTFSASIDSTLTNAGIDPSTFQSRLLSMMQNNSTDTSSLFAGASVGSSIDVMA